MPPMPPRATGSKKSRGSGIQPAAKDSAVYKVKEILDRRTLEGGKKEYLVWWENYPKGEATWEPCENFDGEEGNQAVKEFEAKKKKQVTQAMEVKRAQGREDLLQSVKKNHEAQQALLKQFTKGHGGGKEVDGGSIPSSGDDEADTSTGSDSDSESESGDGSVEKARPRKGAKRSEDVNAANSTPGAGTLLGWVAKPSHGSQGSTLKVSCLLRFRGSLCLKGLTLAFIACFQRKQKARKERSFVWTSGAFKKVQGRWPVQDTTPQQYHALCMIGGKESCGKTINCSSKGTSALINHLRESHGATYTALNRRQNVSLWPSDSLQNANSITIICSLATLLLVQQADQKRVASERPPNPSLLRARRRHPRAGD